MNQRTQSRGRAFGYVRVSSDSQIDNISPEVQRDAIDSYYRFALAKTHDYMGCLSDLGVSGSVPLSERENGGQLVKMLGSGDCVVVYKLDRAFRSALDLAVQVTAWSDCGIAVHFLDLRCDTASTSGRMIIGILSYVAQFERERISERTRDVMAYRKANGLPVGHAPYGFKLVGMKPKRRLAPFPAERAFGRDVLFRHEVLGKTILQIYKDLRAECVCHPRTRRPVTLRLLEKNMAAERRLRLAESGMESGV